MDSDDNQTPLGTNDNDVDDVIGGSHPIDESDDKNIQPDDSLVGYQDELGSGEQNDVTIDEQSRERDDTPAQITGMPEDVAKDELDMLAIDEGGHDSQRDEDRQEHIEDMDENDKDH